MPVQRHAPQQAELRGGGWIMSSARFEEPHRAEPIALTANTDGKKGQVNDRRLPVAFFPREAEEVARLGKVPSDDLTGQVPDRKLEQGIRVALLPGFDKQIDRLPDLTAAGKAAGLVNDAHPAEMIMCPRRGKKKGRE
jgi:hypothetical protein